MQAHELPSLADAPGTSREYETIYILRPTCTNEEVAAVNERVRGIIESMNGKIIKVDNWGKRRLAYEVAKERKGIYLYWQYLATLGVVAEFERNLRMLDAVIRYMTIKVDSDVHPDARPTEVDDETYERAANTAADEEDMYLNRGDGDGDDDDYDRDDDDDDYDSTGEDLDDEKSASDDGSDDDTDREPRSSRADGDASDDPEDKDGDED